MNCSKPERHLRLSSVHGCISKTNKGGKLIKAMSLLPSRCLTRKGRTVHGAAFCFPGYIRISYANATEELVEACKRIQRFCEGLH